MKAHEETWTIDDELVALGDFSATDDSGFCVVTTYPSSDDKAGDKKALERLRLATAAPGMARELRHLVRLLEPKEREGGLDVPGLATLNGARAALKKAGML